MPTKIRLSLLSLALLLAAPLSAPALAAAKAAAKAAASPLAAAEPQIASGSAMIVDLRTNEVLFSS
ncbi:D-alanyl-D-alanine endopeptidase, partial [Klebsiella pneumoniae]|nr:D-alanyl-D-alanine endopeptidase [Klebsiella pneumoniae]